MILSLILITRTDRQSQTDRLEEKRTETEIDSFKFSDSSFFNGIVELISVVAAHPRAGHTGNKPKCPMKASPQEGGGGISMEITGNIAWRRSIQALGVGFSLPFMPTAVLSANYAFPPPDGAVLPALSTTMAPSHPRKTLDMACNSGSYVFWT